MRLILTFLFLLCPVAAHPGAWPREEGKLFLSVAYEVTARRDALARDRMEQTEGRLETYSYSSLYAEYGLTPRVTLGLDLGTEDLPDTRSSIIFLRIPIGAGEGPHRFAAELGVGNREIPDYGLLRGTTEPVIRPGLSWGYGFESRFGNGWAGIDLKLENRSKTGERAYKADLTLGVDRGNGWLVFAQAQASDYPGTDPALRIVPTVVKRITPRISLESAALLGVSGDNRIGLRAALWFEF
jgi:hypothetical protein